MSEKRFKLIKGVKKGTHSGIWDNQKQHNVGIGDELWIGEVVAMLNKGVAIAEENKELKKENEQLKEAKYEYKQDWKQASVNCDLYKQKISFLKEEIKGFEEENEQLRKKLE